MATTKTTARSRTLTPSALTGAEIAIGAALVGAITKTAGDVGIKGGEALLSYLKKEGPIAHRIVASWKEDKDYCIAIEFLNTTPHGGYVETLGLIKPSKNFAFEVAKPMRGEKPISYGDEGTTVEPGSASRPLKWLKEDALLPVYVPAADGVEILLRLKDDAAGTLAKTPVVTLAYEFSIVGGKDAETSPSKKPKQAEVRLRSKGPFYLID